MTAPKPIAADDVTRLIDELHNGRFVTAMDALNWCFRAAAMLFFLREERDEALSRAEELEAEGTAMAEQDRALRITYASLTECQRELGQAEAALAEARVYERTHIENLDLLRDRAEKAEAALAEAQRVIAENTDGLWYKRQAAREFELKQALAEAQRENAELREDIDRVQQIGVEAQRELAMYEAAHATLAAERDDAEARVKELEAFIRIFEQGVHARALLGGRQ